MATRGRDGSIGWLSADLWAAAFEPSGLSAVDPALRIEDQLRHTPG